VLWCCWLGGRKGIRPAKTEWWGAGVVICLERGADLHIAQLMPLPLTVSCSSKIQIRFTFLVPAYLGSPGKRAVKRLCVTFSIRGWLNFLIFRKKSYFPSYGAELWPSNREELEQVVNIFSKQRFPVSQKSRFSTKFLNSLFGEVGQGTVTKIFSLTGLGGSRIIKAKLWPRPENLAKMGCKFF